MAPKPSCAEQRASRRPLAAAEPGRAALRQLAPAGDRLPPVRRRLAQRARVEAQAALRAAAQALEPAVEQAQRAAAVLVAQVVEGDGQLDETLHGLAARVAQPLPQLL